MFLSVLNEKEKKIFGSLISKIAVVDGRLAAEEKEMLNNYKIELNMDDINEFKISFDDALEELSKSSEVAKRAMYLEIVSLVLSDDEVTKEEEELIDEISLKFDIVKDKKKFTNIVKDLKKVYGKLFDLVYVD